MRYFCPGCFKEIPSTTGFCPYCHFSLQDWENVDYSKKLTQALRHREPETRMRAVYLLGERRDLDALTDLTDLFLHTTDPYLNREIVRAMYKIHPAEAHLFFRRQIEHCTSKIVRRAILETDPEICG